MRIVVTGNLGYIGPELGKNIKNYYENCTLLGIDTGLFLQCLTSESRIGDTYYDNQKFCDIRDISINDLNNCDAVVSLAAVSNDPIGNDFEDATNQINFEANCRLANLCSEAGVKKFIFASSCSMYGAGGENAKNESDPTAPLTAYAKSKIGVEKTLNKCLLGSQTKLIFLRFATACGASDRLRLDLVLNDFVASALKYKTISILSDGSPWRPLIDVNDMAKAIIWAIDSKFENHKPISINIGSNDWNFNVIQLAESVAEYIKGTKIIVNPNAPRDNRSYKVDFSLYKSLSGSFYPSGTIDQSLNRLINIIDKMHLPNDGFRKTKYIRLNHIKNLISKRKINKEFRWI